MKFRTTQKARIHRTSLVLLGAVYTGLLFSSPCQAQAVEWLVNGNFEDLSGDFPNGWAITNNPPGTTSGLAGTANGAVFLPDFFGGRISQSGIEVGPEWQFDLYFASGAPLFPDDRTLNFLLDSGGPHINMRINGAGTIQAFQDDWQDLITGGVTFSTDGNFDGDFDDPGDTQNVHRLRVVGDYTSSPNYEVLLSDVGADTFSMMSGPVSFFNGGTPAPGFGLSSVTIRSDASAESFVADEISLTGEEGEPVPFAGLINGDFEDLSGDFPTGWTVVQGTPTAHAGLGGSTTAAFLHKETSSGARDGARIGQNFPGPPGPEWELELLLASEDPGDASARSFNPIFLNDSGGTLNIRVNGEGTLQAANSDVAGVWVDVAGLENKIEFSVDGNGDGDFSDSEDTLNVHRLLLSADYSTESPQYTIGLSEANATDLAFSGTAADWFGGIPEAGSSISQVDFSAMRSGGSYVVDEVVLRSLAAQFQADFDNDGDVDGDDFLLWQSGFPTPSGAGKMDGDADADGDVDGDDFLIWQTEFGTSLGDGSAAVPEPSSLGLLIGLAVMGWISSRFTFR